MLIILKNKYFSKVFIGKNKIDEYISSNNNFYKAKKSFD